MTSESSKCLYQGPIDSNILYKLKRLRLQEEILIQSLKQLGVDNVAIRYHSLEFIEYNKRIYHSYYKIKNMYEDTKTKIYPIDALGNYT